MLDTEVSGVANTGDARELKARDPERPSDPKKKPKRTYRITILSSQIMEVIVVWRTINRSQCCKLDI
jgi:hypothetical protein